jgi:hypothetical protein
MLRILSSLKYQILENYNITFNFFKQRDLLPDDVDDTALGLISLLKNNCITKEECLFTSKLIISNTNDTIVNEQPKREGIIQIYLHPRGRRENYIDLVVCANVINLLYKLDLENEARATENYLLKILENNDYFNGGWNYFSPDTILFFIYKANKDRFKDLLFKRVKERIGTTSHPLDLAMRVKICKDFDINNNELYKLKSLQNEDGSWSKDSLYRSGSSKLYFGGKVISTIFALAALK